MKEDRLIPWLAFNRFSLENLKASVLLYRIFQDPVKIFNATTEELENVEGIHKPTVKRLLQQSDRYMENATKDLEKLKIIGGNVLTLDDPLYPKELSFIYDPPPVLFVLGEVQTLLKYRRLSIVGSRFASITGCRNARKIASELASAGFMIVSGMARGIDTEAHEGALMSGTTTAVLGSGLDKIYPPENKNLFNRILKNGTVVTEFPPGTPPDRFNFPRRNRIISGLSEAVIVVEAARRSGSLITASFAVEQGRDVFAVPGEISARFSEGSNNLIKEGALLVTEVSDILEALDWKRPVERQIEKQMDDTEEKSKEKESLELTPEQKKVLECIGEKPVHVEEIIAKSNLSVPETQNALLMLELNGIIKQEIGKRFKRV